jgi:hypothetical protein
MRPRPQCPQRPSRRRSGCRTELIRPESNESVANPCGASQRANEQRANEQRANEQRTNEQRANKAAGEQGDEATDACP